MGYAAFMRTTVDIRDDALELARKRAEERGLSLGDAVSEAILAAYRQSREAKESVPIDLPVSGRGGLRPGVDLDDSAGLRDVMDGLR